MTKYLLLLAVISTDVVSLVQRSRLCEDGRHAEACDGWFEQFRQLLRISPNYYGDVEARFGLDAELSERLKEETSSTTATSMGNISSSIA